jgi:tetratricopeptide (TPR) repeat protein
VTSETRIGDYRPVAGVLFAHHYQETEIASGEPLSSMQWGRIEANRDLPTSWFAPPEFERTPIQKFTQDLYDQRTDPASVLWTYHEFRRFHPVIETAPAVEFAGYQMLKMENLGTAVELLEQNAADHPQRADAAFGLGRAYETTGDVSRARAEYERALILDPEHRRAKRHLAELSGS